MRRATRAIAKTASGATIVADWRRDGPVGPGEVMAPNLLSERRGPRRASRARGKVIQNVLRGRARPRGQVVSHCATPPCPEQAPLRCAACEYIPSLHFAGASRIVVFGLSGAAGGVGWLDVAAAVVCVADEGGGRRTRRGWRGGGGRRRGGGGVGCRGGSYATVTRARAASTLRHRAVGACDHCCAGRLCAPRPWPLRRRRRVPSRRRYRWPWRSSRRCTPTRLHPGQRHSRRPYRARRAPRWREGGAHAWEGSGRGGARRTEVDTRIVTLHPTLVRRQRFR